MWKRSFVSILIFIILVGCGSQNEIVVTPSSIPPTTTFTPKPTATQLPTRTPTLTPVATLSPDDALEAFKNLVEQGNDCKLPCWLGINIGDTKFNEVPNKLLMFNSITQSKFNRKDASVIFFFPNFNAAKHSVYTYVVLGSGGSISEIIVNIGVYPLSSENPPYVNSSYQKMWQRYLISGLFKDYGQPEKIFLDTTLTSGDPTKMYPFVIWVIYPNHGFLMRYEGFNIKAGENIKICPMQSDIDIKIWDPEKGSYEKIIKNDGALSKPFALGPQPIENVTEFSIESFYETFKNAQIDSCFNTPASIWPPNN